MTERDCVDAIESAIDEYRELRSSCYAYKDERPLQLHTESIDGGPRWLVSARLTREVPREIHNHLKYLVEHLRSALDYAVTMLSDAKKPQFPLLDKKLTCFASQTKNQTSGLSADKLKDLELFQPCNHPDGCRSEPLYWLQKITNTSKHTQVVRPTLCPSSLNIARLRLKQMELRPDAFLRFDHSIAESVLLTTEWQEVAEVSASGTVKAKAVSGKFEIEHRLMIQCDQLSLLLLTSCMTMIQRVEEAVGQLLDDPDGFNLSQETRELEAMTAEDNERTDE